MSVEEEARLADIAAYRAPFSEVHDRFGTHAMKWDVQQGELPMWVADMDFPTAPGIVEAMRRRLSSGIFGYSVVPERWTEAIRGWWRERHRFEILPEWLTFCTGVVPAISSIIRRLTCVGENVVVQTPVYGIFFNSIRNNGRVALENPLLYDGDTWRVDFADLERKLANPQTTLMLLCSPHNPVGRVWDRETLARIGELCAHHHVVVVSDEIHCDLTLPGITHVPFASISKACRENSVTCIAPTKAFNLAGLQTAAIVTPNPQLRSKVVRGLNTDEVAEPNVFAIEAAIAAFTTGGDWLDALRRYLAENRRIAEIFLQRELPQLVTVPAEGTYLLWIDCGAVMEDATVFCQVLRQMTGLILSKGADFGGIGRRFVRMNLACPQGVLADGLFRLKRGMDAWEAGIH